MAAAAETAALRSKGFRTVAVRSKRRGRLALSFRRSVPARVTIDVLRLDASAVKRIARYSDRKTGVVRIPMDRAMAIIIERKLIGSAAEPAGCGRSIPGLFKRIDPCGAA